MKVEVVVKSVDKIELGDIIESSGDFYLVMERGDGAYVARNMCGYGGLHGVYNSMEDLNKEYFKRFDLAKNSTIYKKHDYKLQLVGVDK